MLGLRIVILNPVSCTFAPYVYNKSMLKSHFFIRNVEAEHYLENFLIASVSSVLLLRFFLKITGNPTIGGERFHIAHMLWGGFIMVIAISLLLTFLNRTISYLASILGGVGYGIFIDELGKFITRDNNYFFQPTIAIMYVIFITLYLTLRVLPLRKAFTQKEYLVNAIELLKDAVANDLDTEEKKLAREYLRKADPKDPMVIMLRKMFSEIDAIPQPEPSLPMRALRVIRSKYYEVTRSQFFFRLLFSIFILQAVVTVFFLITIYFLSVSRFIVLNLTFSEWGLLFSSLAAAITMFFGLRHFRSDRLRSYHIFQTAVLINIFLTQFFLFYLFQFYALIGLLLNLSLFISLNYVILRTKEKS